ncbi:MAG: hypothetical protein ACRYG2_38605 [Janthinobacterium lividum]
MPERIDGPETDDLDLVFRELVDDVETRSQRPGADRAVRTAGARRLAVASSALAVVLIVAAAFGGRVLQGGRGVGVPAEAGPSATASTPSAPPVHDPDGPAPALMTLDRLNEASKGWATWEEGTVGRADVPRCLRQTTAPTGATSEHDHARAGTNASLARLRLRLATRDDSNKAVLATAQAFISCPEHTGLQNYDVSADLEIVGVPWTEGDRRGTVWLIDFGDRMDLFSVVGVPRPSVEVVNQVSGLLAADVQVP